MLNSLTNRFIQTAPPDLLARMVPKASPAYFRKRQLAAFRFIVRYAARHSPFYRRRFEALGIDARKVNAPEDLGDFYTLPEDIVEYAEEFLCKKPEIVFESSGTTGRNKRIYLTQDELDIIGHNGAIGLYGLGLDKNDRLVNAFDFNIWIPGMVTQKVIEHSGIFGMPAGKVDPMEIYKRIPIYKFNVIFGEPTWLIRLTEIAEQKGAYPLKMLVGSAEALPERARAWMEKVWMGAKVRMMYGTVESAGAMGFEYRDCCQAYHLNDNNFLAEIYQSDADGYGEFVFTALDRYTMPLIRYRNRDITRFIPEPCSCGLPMRRIARIRGRADELVVASGGNLYPLMFEEILRDVDGVTSDWQIIFKLDGIKEVMTFKLEMAGGDKEAIQKKIYRNTQERYPDLWKNYTLGIFGIEFLYHEKGALRKGRKLVRVVDERKF
ncbi:MAG: AMP-binding protein [Candidatus Omnitrophota bacterium]